MWDFLQDQSAKMQQDICDPPNVAGWPAYYQIPMFHETWINHDTMPRRGKLSDQLISTGYMRGTNLIIDPVAFTEQFTNAGIDTNLFINDVLEVLYRVPISQAEKDKIKQQLLTGQTTDSYWTDAWNNRAAQLSSVTTRLQTFYKYIMSLAEYQLA